MIDRVRIAAAHFAPVYNDADATVEKIGEIVREASRKGIQLLAFPEVFIPGFPHWCRLVAPDESDNLYTQLAAESVCADGIQIERVRQFAKNWNMVISLGFTECVRSNKGSIWNSTLLIDADGVVLNHHRKLVPTFAEKLIYAPGDGYGLKVCETKIGRVGGLICGENTNPLARYTLMAQGEQVHIANYPSVVPTRKGGTDGFDLTEGIRIRAAGHSFEAKIHTVVAASPFDQSARSWLEPQIGSDKLQLLDNGAKAVSLVIDPNGKIVSDVLKDEEGFAWADVDIGSVPLSKRMHDVVGHYNRFDVFRLTVNRERLEPIRWDDSEGNEATAEKQDAEDYVWKGNQTSVCG